MLGFLEGKCLMNLAVDDDWKDKVRNSKEIQSNIQIIANYLYNRVGELNKFAKNIPADVLKLAMAEPISVTDTFNSYLYNHHMMRNKQLCAVIAASNRKPRYPVGSFVRLRNRANPYNMNMVNHINGTTDYTKNYANLLKKMTGLTSFFSVTNSALSYIAKNVKPLAIVVKHANHLPVLEARKDAKVYGIRFLHEGMIDSTIIYVPEYSIRGIASKNS